MIQFCMEWRCAPKNRLKEINLNLPSVLRRSHSLIHRYVQISMGIFQCFSYRTCNKSCMYALHVVTFATNRFARFCYTRSYFKNTANLYNTKRKNWKMILRKIVRYLVQQQSFLEYVDLLPSTCNGGWHFWHSSFNLFEYLSFES